MQQLHLLSSELWSHIDCRLSNFSMSSLICAALLHREGLARRAAPASLVASMAAVSAVFFQSPFVSWTTRHQRGDLRAGACACLPDGLCLTPLAGLQAEWMAA